MSVTVHVTPNVSYSYENREDVVKALGYSKNHQAALEKWLQDNPKTIGDLPEGSYDITLRCVDDKWQACVRLPLKDYFTKSSRNNTPNEVIAQLKRMEL